LNLFLSIYKQSLRSKVRNKVKSNIPGNKNSDCPKEGFDRERTIFIICGSLPFLPLPGGSL
jgi:hypothetical protein